MTPKAIIPSTSHSHIEKLDTNARCIIENDSETISQNSFIFTQIRYDDDDNQFEYKNGDFKVYTKSNKMKYQGNSFAWYRNRNIPSITVKKEDKQETSVQVQKKSSSQRNDAYTFYINACYIEKNKFVVTSLKGETSKLDQSQCSFDSLKFEKTSYILNGSCVRLFIIIFDSNYKIVESYISSQIHISSWKNYLKDKPSKSAIFSPFMPAILNRIHIIPNDNTALQKKAKIMASASQTITICDNIQGLSDYFKGSTIKQKICHPLFLAIKFANTINLYFSEDLVPKDLKEEDNRLEYQIRLFINIHKYFCESLCSKNHIQKKIAIEIRETQRKGLDEKVKDFLKKIYSDFVLFINKKDDSLKQFRLFAQDDLQSMQLAYKLAFPKLEMMLLSFQKYHMIENQQRFYQQEHYSEKDEDSECLYSIPNLQITLNREFVNSENAMKLPVFQNQSNQSTFISQSSPSDRQRINSISSCGQRISQRLSTFMVQSKQSSQQRNIVYEPQLKKHIKNQQTLDAQQQDSKSFQESLQYSYSQQDQVQIKKCNSNQKKSPQIKQNMVNKEHDYQSSFSNFNDNLQKQQDEQENYSDKLEKSNNSFRLSQTKEEIRTAYSKITSNTINKNYNYKNNSLEHQHLKIEDLKNIDQAENLVSEQSNCQSSHGRSQHSNFDFQNTENNSIQLNKNPSINYSTSINQQSQTLIIPSNSQKTTSDTLLPNNNTFNSDQKINNQQSNYNQSQISYQPQQNFPDNYQSFPQQQNSFNLNQILPPPHFQNGIQVYMPNPGYQFVQILQVPSMGYQPLIYSTIPPSPHNLNFQKQ